MRYLLLISLSIILAASMVAGGCSTPTSTPAQTTATAAPVNTQASAPTPANPIKLVFTHTDTADSFWATDFYLPFFADLEKRTGGRVKVEAHWNGELAGQADAFNASVRGTVDLAHFVPTSGAPKIFVMDGVINLSPYDISCYRPSRVYWELYQEFPEMRAEWKDVKVIWIGASTPSFFGTVKKQVNTLEDTKGLKINSSGIWMSAREKALGMAPMTVLPPDVFTSLQKGVLDAATASWFSLWSLKTGDAFKYLTMAPLAATPYALSMNLKTWNSLPPDIQKIIDGMTNEYVDFYDRAQAKSDATLKVKAFQQFNLQEIDPTTDNLAQFAATDKSVQDSFTSQLESQGLPGKKLLDEYSRLEKKYSASEYAFNN